MLFLNGRVATLKHPTWNMKLTGSSFLFRGPLAFCRVCTYTIARVAKNLSHFDYYGRKKIKMNPTPNPKFCDSSMRQTFGQIIQPQDDHTPKLCFFLSHLKNMFVKNWNILFQTFIFGFHLTFRECNDAFRWWFQLPHQIASFPQVDVNINMFKTTT